jgi:hypothetical protein
MKTRLTALALAAGILFPNAASAVAPPANILFAGGIKRAIVNGTSGGYCLVDGGSSTFIRRGTLTLITFPDITFAPTGSVGPAYTMAGQAALTSNTATSGKIEFQPVAGPTGLIPRNPSYTHYAADYDSATHIMTVTFRIHFSMCTLLVSATYRN